MSGVEVVFLNYKAAYTLLFNYVADAIEYLDDGETAKARETLIRAHLECEEMYVKNEKGIGILFPMEDEPER